jgi:hypothetical protein
MERCSAAMRFFEPTLDHRAVTALLGREPSYAHLPGERINDGVYSSRGRIDRPPRRLYTEGY